LKVDCPLPLRVWLPGSSEVVRPAGIAGHAMAPRLHDSDSGWSAAAIVRCSRTAMNTGVEPGANGVP